MNLKSENWEDSTLGRFCLGRFCLGRFCLGRFCCGEILLRGNFAAGRFCCGEILPGRFCLGRFCLGRFCLRIVPSCQSDCSPLIYLSQCRNKRQKTRDRKKLRDIRRAESIESKCDQFYWQEITAKSRLNIKLNTRIFLEELY